MTGSIVLAVMVVAILSHLGPIDDPIDDSMKCPRCGAVMQDIGSGVGGCVGIPLGVVPRILVVTCPQCEYSERSWA